MTRKHIWELEGEKKIDIMASYFFTGLGISLLDNAPNLVVGCIIEKRIIIYGMKFTYK